MATTYRDLIASAMRTLGVIGQGQTPSGAQAQDALYILKELIDRMNATDTMLYTTTIQTQVLTGGVSSYTVGPGEDIDIAQRPTKLQAAWLRDTSNAFGNYIDRRMNILSATEWGNIVAKTVTSNLPYFVYFDAAWPDATLHLWPVPSAGNTLVLHWLTSLDSDITLDDEENLPPAYRAALKWNLAIAMAPEYGEEPTATILNQATAATLAIQQSTFSPERMEYDYAATGAYDIVSDSFRTR